METTPLLTPYAMGKFNLAHRVVLAPVTRCRSYGNLPQPHNTLYYEQRAAPGTLLIAEASAVSETATAYPCVPGLWSEEHVEAWKPVVDAVHAKGAFFFCQICHTGSLSPTDCGAPAKLPKQEIPQMMKDFRVAARNAIKAGFDGVEIHAANGFLVNELWFMGEGNAIPKPMDHDQAMKDGGNDGGSLEILCRFVTDVVAAVVDEVGVHHVGVRLSPFVEYVEHTDMDLEAHAMHVVRYMDELGVLYCHVVVPRICVDGENNKLGTPHRLVPFRKAFRGTFIVNGGYDREQGDNVISEGYADLVSYGRLFLANPDLPERFRKNADLNNYDRSTFYTSDPVVGYTDYPFLEQEIGVAS